MNLCNVEVEPGLSPEEGWINMRVHGWRGAGELEAAGYELPAHAE